MHIQPYKLEHSTSRRRYRFTSEGTKGLNQVKIIEFYPIENEDFDFPENIPLFNLGFGDTLDGIEVNDKARSNNGDMEIVLRTVAESVELFLTEYPSAAIFFEGSTPSCTRLYRKMINKYYEDISKNFIIWGIYNDTMHLFQPNTSLRFDAFLVKQR